MAEFVEVQGLMPIQAREGIQQSVLARNTCDQPRGYLYVRQLNNLDPKKRILRDEGTEIIAWSLAGLR